MEIKDYWNRINETISRSKILNRFNPLEKLFGQRVRLGLDIGTYSIKAVQLQDTPGGLSAVKLGYKQIQPEESKSSEIGESSLARTISELWKEQMIKSRRVKLVISDKSVYSRHISIPRVPEEELIKAIKWQAEKYIPFSIDDAIVDFQTLGSVSQKSPAQIGIVIVAAKKETINKYLSVLKTAGLVPIIVNITPFAVARSLLRSCLPDKMVAVIDIGARVTSVIMLKGGCLQFVRNIELAGNNFTQAIAHGLNVAKMEAEKIKKESLIFRSEDVPQQERADIFAFIKPVLDDWLEEINRSLSYCESEFMVEEINKIILCGGGARFEGLDKFLAEKLMLPVEIASPFENIAITQNKFLKELLPGLTAALGAAL